jgi:Flp pilus assembly protein TadD
MPLTSGRLLAVLLAAGAALVAGSGALSGATAASSPTASPSASTTASPAPSPVAEPPASTDAESAAPSPRNGAALETLEAAVAADPDDLRPANTYRREVIRAGAYDRALRFYERLTAGHPRSAHAWLNYGYVYVDKIPAAGSITQVILANEALGRFDRAIELAPESWIAHYTRGNAYLYWPKVFGKGPLAVADLERAVALARAAPRLLRVHSRSWVALGDAYWRTDRRERARALWGEAKELFPGETAVAARLGLADDEVDRFLYDTLDPGKRVDTDLTPLIEETPVAR